MVSISKIALSLPTNQPDAIHDFAEIAEIPLKEALSSPEAPEGKVAIHREISSMVENKSWDIIDCSTKRSTVGCRIVLSNKYKADRTLEIRRARLVAKGFTQKSGIDETETFAPNLSSIRLVMALAINHEMPVHQIDVTAFLNGEIEEGVLSLSH